MNPSVTYLYSPSLLDFLLSYISKEMSENSYSKKVALTPSFLLDFFIFTQTKYNLNNIENKFVFENRENLTIPKLKEYFKNKYAMHLVSDEQIFYFIMLFEYFEKTDNSKLIIKKEVETDEIYRKRIKEILIFQLDKMNKKLLDERSYEIFENELRKKDTKNDENEIGYLDRRLEIFDILRIYAMARNILLEDGKLMNFLNLVIYYSMKFPIKPMKPKKNVIDEGGQVREGIVREVKKGMVKEFGLGKDIARLIINELMDEEEFSIWIILIDQLFNSLTDKESSSNNSKKIDLEIECKIWEEKCKTLEEECHSMRMQLARSQIRQDVLSTNSCSSLGENSSSRNLMNYSLSIDAAATNPQDSLNGNLFELTNFLVDDEEEMDGKTILTDPPGNIPNSHSKSSSSSINTKNQKFKFKEEEFINSLKVQISTLQETILQNQEDHFKKIMEVEDFKKENLKFSKLIEELKKEKNLNKQQPENHEKNRNSTEIEKNEENDNFSEESVSQENQLLEIITTLQSEKRKVEEKMRKLEEENSTIAGIVDSKYKKRFLYLKSFLRFQRLEFEEFFEGEKKRSIKRSSTDVQQRKKL